MKVIGTTSDSDAWKGVAIVQMEREELATLNRFFGRYESDLSKLIQMDWTDLRKVCIDAQDKAQQLAEIKSHHKQLSELIAK